MKYLLYLLLLASFGFPSESAAQNEMPLSVLVPSDQGSLSRGQLQRLGSQTKKMVTNNGLAASGSQQFAVIPLLTVQAERQADLMSGPVHTVEIEVLFEIKQLDNQITYNTAVLTSTGQGSSRNSAISDAINSLNTKDGAIKSFFHDSQIKMLHYYQNNCEHLMNEAQTLINTKSYSKAMTLLYSIPRGTTCFQESREQIEEAFLFYQNQHCQEWLNKARTLLSNNQYAAALAVLSQIDPTSSCEGELKSMISKTAKKVDAEEAKQWDALQERYHNSLALEEMRIEMMSKLMSEYYQRQPAAVQQFIVIK